jgi:hypothetical protein
MTDQTQPCPRCDGCGQLANSDEREPWSVWMAATQLAQPTGYELGNAVARVVAEHTGLKAHEIVELVINADSIWVVYGIRTGPKLEDIHTRTRRIDTETGEMISDRDGRF